MKNIELTKAVLAALLLTSSAVMAETDYPASDFQPKVVFSDESAVSSAPSAKPAGSAAVDDNFPAANYQPKVLFTDAEYKHSSAAPKAQGYSKSTAGESSASAAVEVIQNEKEASSSFSYIGLIALAIAGFFVYNKKSGVSTSEVKTNRPVSRKKYVASAAGDSTGVEKYLAKLGGDKTGVAKYLEKQTKNPSTGVAKYMAKQIVKDREAAAARATGVEKYLRDKG